MHPDISYFFMTIPEACCLEMVTMCHMNEIFVFDMGESVKIADLVRRMIVLAVFCVDEDIQIDYTGLCPGEKLYEEVLANNKNTLSYATRKDPYCHGMGLRLRRSLCRN